MVRRALLLLAATGALAACATQGVPTAYAPPPPSARTVPPRVAILLPLSAGGTLARVAQDMLQAARLGMGGAPLDVEDTAGTASGAAQAVSRAIAAQDALILGPLTAGETEAISGPARQAGIPVLAFTNDGTAARPGVWTLGITPTQQVRRMLAAASADGRSKLVAVLPQSAFGDALAQAFAEAPASGLAVSVRRYAGIGGLDGALRSASDYDARLQAAQGAPSSPGASPPSSPMAGPLGPPPFDALFLAQTDNLDQMRSLLHFYGIGLPEARIMGPSLWSGLATRLGFIAGAWYPAPDPASRIGFVRLYQASYGAPPPQVADIAFDAAALARVLGQGSQGRGGGYTIAALTKPDGFAGTDGLFALLPDGRVRRGLAVWQIEAAGGARIVQPAPLHLPAPGV